MLKTVGVVSKDAGSANQIAWHVKNVPGKYFFALEEPALSIFERVLGPVENCELERLVLVCDELISGTGWQSDFEWLGMQTFLANSKRVTTYLDNWNNYPERFIRNGVKIQPSILWVSDSIAQEKATIEFPDIPVVLQRNYYLDSIREICAKVVTPATIHKVQRNILYLTEPISEVQTFNSIPRKFTEYDALQQFLSEYYSCRDLELNLRIRLHPSEKPEKYSHLVTHIDEIKSKSSDLAVDLAWSDFVIGVDTYAMHVAGQLGLPVATSAAEMDFQGSIPWGNIISLKKVGLRNFLSKK
jgi:hypothetical protein